MFYPEALHLNWKLRAGIIFITSGHTSWVLTGLRRLSACSLPASPVLYSSYHRSTMIVRPNMIPASWFHKRWNFHHFNEFSNKNVSRKEVHQFRSSTSSLLSNYQEQSTDDSYTIRLKNIESNKLSLSWVDKGMLSWLQFNNYFIILLIQQVILMPQSSKQFLIDLDLMKNSWSMSIIATSTCWYLQVSLLNAERMLKDYEPLILLRQRIFNLND